MYPKVGAAFFILELPSSRVRVSKTIIKIKAACRNIQRPAGDVFGQFFLSRFHFSLGVSVMLAALCDV